MKRHLIVNADDFGRSAGINQGIIEAHVHGIVTSASLMVRWRDSSAAAALARDYPDLSVGLHIDLGEWQYTDSEWRHVYGVVPLDDATAIGKEIQAQLEFFREVLRKNPTHLDSHQHVHRDEPVRSILKALGEELNVPVRHFSTRVQHCGAFYGQSGKGEPFPDSIDVNALLNILASLPPGWTELACHPGLEEHLESTYGKERTREVESLCDPRLRAALKAEDIELCSFAALRREGH